jgi:hypothetical protein
MGMQFVEPIDTYGLPVYKATKVMRERVGDEIRMLIGHEMFGRTVWTHILIMSAADVLIESQKCQEIATRPHNQEIRLPHH